MQNAALSHNTCDIATSEAALGIYARDIVDRKYLNPHPTPTEGAEAEAQVYHNHHILPKSLYPEFAKKRWNFVRLSLEEHFHAHVLLAKMMHEQVAMHQALYVMTLRYPIHDPAFDWAQAEESERKANAAASLLQSKLRAQDWQTPEYAQKISQSMSLTNLAKWQDEEYRHTQTAAIKKGRQEKFYANPEAVMRATKAQSEKTSGERHWRFQPVNIYRHDSGALVAEHVCLSDFCKKHNLNQPHMQLSISADRSRPSGRGNRAHSKGYFARAVDEHGKVIGEVGPAVPQPEHHHARPADIYRASDNVCVARGVIIRQFCQRNELGIRFSQSALSRTALADLSKPSTTKNPCAHKGYYARYHDQNKDS